MTVFHVFRGTSLVLLLIILSGTVYSVGYFNELFVVNLLFIIALLVFGKIDRSRLRSFLIFLVISVGIILLNIGFAIEYNIVDYIFLFFRLILSGLAWVLLRNHSVLDLYLKIFRGLLYLSIFGFILSQFNLGSELTFDEYKVSSIFYAHFYSSFTYINGVRLNRNSGIFWEPGLFAVYACFYLYLVLLLKRNLKSSLLASVVILTTISSTGIMVMAIIWSIYFLKNYRRNLLRSFWVSALLVFTFSVAVVSIREKKLESSTKGVSSYGLRTFDVISGLKIIQTNPLTGIGLSKEVYAQEISKLLPVQFRKDKQFMRERGNSNAIIGVFIVYGIPIGLLVLALVYRGFYSITGGGGIFWLWLILASSSPIIFTPFFVFVMINGLSHRSIVPINSKNEYI